MEHRRDTGSRRDIETQLDAAITACVDSGSGSVLRLHGEAGIGKTTLLVHSIDVAASRGLDVWTSTATELTMTQPNSIIESLRSLDGRPFLPDSMAVVSARQGPYGQPVNPEATRFPVLEVVIEAAESHARQPILIAVDDAQWIDAASVTMLVAIAEIAITHPVVVVVAHRSAVGDGPIVELIAALDRYGAHELAVGPLTEPEMLGLLAELCGGSPGQTLIDRAMGAAGNPFLLREFVNGLLAEGQLESDGHQVDVGPDGVPESLRAAVARQLASLGADTVLVVRACSVHGFQVDISSLAAMLQRTPISLASPIESACAAGLLEEHDAELRFRHELVRAAIYNQMPQAVRKATHLDLADVLARRGAPAAIVGAHLVLGSDGADPLIVEQLRRAADETAGVDPTAALAFLDRARSLAGIELDARRVIERARLDALTGAGRTAEAEAVALWLLDVSEPAECVEVLARLGGLATITGDSPRAIGYLDEACQAAQSDAERSPILAMASTTCATNGEYERARELAAEAIELGRRAGEPIGQSVGMALLARMSTYGNEVEQGLRLGAAAVAIADADPTGGAHAYVPGLHFGMTAFDADQLDVALDMVDHGNDLAAVYGMAWSLPLFGALAAGCHYRRGDLDAASAEAATAVALAEQTNSRQSLTWAYSVLALTAVDQHELPRARDWLAAADDSWRTGMSPLGIDHLILAKARVAAADGDPDGAYRELSEAWDLFDEVQLQFCQPMLAFDLAMLAAERGDIDRLKQTEMGTIQAAQASAVPALAATANWISAVANGDGSGARTALERLRSTERRLDVARWTARAPELVALDGEIDAELRDALAIFDECGAAGCAAAIRAMVGPAAPAGADPHAGSGVRFDLLTATELEIVRHLSEGCTNAEIAHHRGSSRRTVESHLRKVYEKLGIDGRVRLTVAASEYFR